MIRFCSLASGSRGNALLVEAQETLILVDCGVNLRTLTQRLQRVGKAPADIDAVVLTHEHSDHIAGLGTFLKHRPCPVFSTHGTARSLPRIEDHRIVRHGVEFSFGGLRVHPFPVPHDAREPVQYRFEAGGRRLGILTDTGHVSSHVAQTLAGVDAIAVEFNHDLDALNEGPYPPPLKARVGSDFGHLNNAQAAALVAELDCERLRWVVALHVSEKNNSPAHVESSVARLPGRGAFEFRQATQGVPTDWFELA